MAIHAMITRDVKGDFTINNFNWLQIWQFESQLTRGSCLFLGYYQVYILKGNDAVNSNALVTKNRQMLMCS